VSAIVFGAILLIALIYNIVVLSVGASETRRIQAQLALNEQILADNEAALECGYSEENIEDYARRYLDMHNGDESLFKAR